MKPTKLIAAGGLGAVLVVAVGLVVGCDSRGVPSGLSDRVWHGAVVGIRGELLDLKELRVLSLVPFVKSVLGEERSRAYDMPGDELRLSFALASGRGRFLACEARDGLSVCLIGTFTRQFSIMRCPEWGSRVSVGAWNRDGDSLLCFCYRPAEELQEGHLYLLRRGEGGWSWLRLAGAGKVSGRKGSYEITKGAWVDDSTILLSSDGRIVRFGIRTGMLERGPEGHAPYALGGDRIIWRKEGSYFAPMVTTRWERCGEADRARALSGDAAVLNGWPVISPDGSLVLFVERRLSSLWGHAAISRRLCLYDVEADRFYRLLRGSQRESPIMDVAAAGLWIHDDGGLRRAARLRQGGREAEN